MTLTDRIFLDQIARDVGKRSPNYRNKGNSTHSNSSRRCWSGCQSSKYNVCLFKSLHYAEPTVLSTTATDLHRLRMLSVVDVGDVLGALAWCLGSQRRLLQRCTILLFLWLCNFHWNLLPARDCQQKIASDCLDTACSRRATEVKRALRSDSHRIVRNGSTELPGWNWVRLCVGRKSEIPSL